MSISPMEQQSQLPELSALSLSREEFGNRANGRMAGGPTEILQSPASSPEALLPAFEGCFPASSPVLAQAGDCDHAPMSPERSTSSPRRRLSRNRSSHKLSRHSPGTVQPNVCQRVMDPADYRNFRKAELRLTQAVKYLSSLHRSRRAATPPEATNSQGGPASPSRPSSSSTSSGQAVTPQSPTSPSSASRRSRLLRALSSSSSPPPTASGSDSQSPRSPGSRPWSRALHAILSPSPSVPPPTPPQLASTDDIAWAEATTSSPIVNRDEMRRWEVITAVDMIRRSQHDLLKLISEVLVRLNIKSFEPPAEVKESVFFLAQFLRCQGQIPETDHLEEDIRKLRAEGVSLCRSFSKLRGLEVTNKPFTSSFTAPGILVYNLEEHKPIDFDIFGSRSGAPKPEDLAILLQNFMESYTSFVNALRGFHAIYRADRRCKRRERRLARIQKASSLLDLDKTINADEALPGLEIAALSTQDLILHALQQSLADGLFSEEDVEAFDPRLMMTLPRLSLFYGIRQSAFPIDYEYPEKEKGAPTIPLDVFLPRICRKLPFSQIAELCRLSDEEAAALAKRLSGGDMLDSVYENPRILETLFITICSEADGGINTVRDPRAVKIMSRALAMHMSESIEDHALDDDSTISKSYIMLMSVAASRDRH